MSVYGSSPLTRGKPVDKAGVGFGDRLIPAHAGKTELTGTSDSARGAHPRSRGENYKQLTLAELEEGSSPLTQGNI